MKKRIKNLFLVLGCTGVVVMPAAAQPFTTLHTFRVTSSSSISSQSATADTDGANPQACLMLSSNALYGTTFSGGSGAGTVFAANLEGTSFTNLHTFTAGSGSYPNVTNSDGDGPMAPLIVSGNTLYGTAVSGGSSGWGTIFAVNSDGSGFTNLYSFTGGSDGAYPESGLIISGNTLYGTASEGGTTAAGDYLSSGTVFKINTDGTGFTNLYSFTGGNDGANPETGLVLLGNTLYGTASIGGSSGRGTVFAVNTDGSGFTNLYSFTGGSDGDGPDSDLILSGNTLYGTAEEGGSADNGTVFAINTDGSGFTNLHNFTAGYGYLYDFSVTNSDGAYPESGLILSGNTLYGTAEEGGSAGNGTMFALSTDGTAFTTLYNFPAGSGSYPYDSNNDGAYPEAGLILSSNTLYGTAFSGGSSGYGTVFSITLPGPQLTITPSGANMVLTWPTNATGFTLQSTIQLGDAAAWNPVSPLPVVVNGQNAVTDPISGPQQFYRLIR